MQTDVRHLGNESIAFMSLSQHCADLPFSSALSSFSAQYTVIESQTHHSLLVSAVLPLDLPGLHTPQTSKVV